MNPTDTSVTNRAIHHSDIALVVWAWSVASAGVLLGGKAIPVVLLIMSLPLACFWTRRIAVGRGGIVGCIVASLGFALLAAGPTGGHLEAILLLAILETGTLIGAAKAGRMMPDMLEAPGERPWMKIVVASNAVAKGIERPLIGRPI